MMNGKKDGQYVLPWFEVDQVPDGLFYGDMEQKIDEFDDDNDDQPYQNQDESDKMDVINEGESDCDDVKMLSFSSVE